MSDNDKRWKRLLEILRPMSPTALGEADAAVAFGETASDQTERADAFRMMIETMPALVYLAELDDRRTALFIGPHVLDLLGFQPYEFLADPDLWRRRLHQDDRDRVWAELAYARSEHRPFESEYRMVARDGRIVWLQDRAQILQGPQSRTALLMGVLCDVTNIKAAEAAHQDQLEFLQTLIDTIPSPIFYKNKDGIYTGCNRAFEEFLGIPRDRIVGQSVYGVSPPDLADKYREKDNEMFRRPGKQGYDASVVYADGTRHDVVFNKATFLDRNGELSGLVGVITDITDRKRAEQALIRAHRALRTLSECNEALVREHSEPDYLADICRIIVERGDYHAAWVGYAGLDPDRTVRPVARAGPGDGFLDQAHLTWDDSKAGQTPIGSVIRTGRPVLQHNIPANPDLQPWRSDAERYGYASSLFLPLIRDEDVMGVLTIHARETDAFDGEERKLLGNLADSVSFGIMAGRTRTRRDLAEEALREAHQALEVRVRERTAELARANQELTLEIAERHKAEADALKSAEKLKMFAYSIVHDLKSPTMGLYGLTKSLQKHCGALLDEKAQEYCEQILNASKYVAALVENINSYVTAKESPLNIETVSFLDILGQVWDEFSAQITLRRIEWVVPERETALRVDRLSLLRVLRNCVDNALKYGGEHLTRIEIGYEEKDPYHTIFVADDGAGLSVTDPEKIFGPFQRFETAKGTPGAGLGLAIVREVAERHGGAVWIEKERGRGAKFVVAFSKDL